MASIPSAQVHVFAWQATPLSVQPTLQLAQAAALLEEHLDPVAACPFEQVQTLA
jgi:hypothetical protein